MAAALGALSNDSIDAQRLQMLCQHGGGDNRDHLDAGSFPHGHVFARVACTGGHNGHALVYHDLRKNICLRMHEHDVHAERLVGQLLAAADVLAQGVGVHAARTNDAQRTRVGAGGGKLAGGNVGHTALNDGVFCA